MALYRKYRPQKLSELDSQTLGKRLTTIFSSGRLPHAFLFAGPKGTGKTSTARIIAKSLNCTNNRRDKKPHEFINPEPCNSCDHCIAITEGKDLDVIEIDAASNRGIDEIRQLRENIKLSPLSGFYKVYIIDEVHMLTNEAFNALLKTLEEPPAHAIFILATTEAEKLPDTIVSRCLVLPFQKATDEEIVHSLKRVIKGEKVNVSEDILFLIAQAADGSFRDATKMLEQAIAEGVLEADTIGTVIGGSGQDVHRLLQFLYAKDGKGALEFSLSLEAKGADIKYIVSALLHRLHELLLATYGIKSDNKQLKTGESFVTKELLALIKLFSRVFTELKTASSPTLPLEVAIVEWCEGNKQA